MHSEAARAHGEPLSVRAFSTPRSSCAGRVDIEAALDTRAAPGTIASGPMRLRNVCARFLYTRHMSRGLVPARCGCACRLRACARTPHSALGTTGSRPTRRSLLSRSRCESTRRRLRQLRQRMKHHAAAAPARSHNIARYSFVDVFSGTKVSPCKPRHCALSTTRVRRAHTEVRLALRSDALLFLCCDERATVFLDVAPACTRPGSRVVTPDR